MTWGLGGHNIRGNEKVYGDKHRWETWNDTHKEEKMGTEKGDKGQGLTHLNTYRSGHRHDGSLNVQRLT